MKRLLTLIFGLSVLIGPFSQCAAAPATPEPTGEVLFQDDFQDGNSDGWQISGAWTVQQNDDVYVFNTPGPAGLAWVPAGAEWADYLFRAGVRLEEGAMALGFRGTHDSRYWLYYEQEGLYLLKESPRGKFVPLTQTAAPELKTAHGLAILGYGGHLRVFVDKELQMDYEDPTPLALGTIGLAALEGCKAAVDNVMISKLTTPLPPVQQAALPPPAAPPSGAVLAQQFASVADMPDPSEPAAPDEGAAPAPIADEQPAEAPAPAWDEAPPPSGLPVIDYFNAEPVPERPGCAYLSWDLHDATAAYLNDQGVTAPNSTEVCEAGAYTLRAENQAGSVQQTLSIVSVDGEVQKVSGPDLRIAASSVQVPDPARPNRTQIQLTIRNSGDAPAGAFTVRWYPHQASDVVACSVDIGELAAQGQGVARCSYAYPAGEIGTMHWRAVADADDDIGETNETNNVVEGTVQIAASAKSDLLITEKRFDPATVVKGQPFKALMTVKNQGGAAAGAFRALWHFHANLGLEDCSWQAGAGLAPGATMKFACDRTTNVAPGQAPTTLTVDAENVVPESDEVNNDASLTLTIKAASGGGGAAAKPDLLITEKRFDPATVVKGQPFNVLMTVKNQGGAAAGAFRALWHFHADLGLEDCSWQVGAGLAPGATMKFACDRTTNVAPGQAPTTLTVDAENVVPESDEVNNDTSLTLTIKAAGGGGGGAAAKPDLLITEKRFDPATVVKGQPFKVLMTVKNQGGAAAGAFRALWHFHANLGLEDCSWQAGAGLAPGATMRFACDRTTNVAPGQAPTTLTVDAENVVSESDEVNNDTSLTLTIKAAGGGGSGGAAAKPDLLITEKRFDPATVVKGQPFKALMTVKNQGGAAAGAFRALWHFHANLGLEDCSWQAGAGLAPGATMKFACDRTTNVAPGQAPTTLTVDAENVVPESDEVNNDTSLTLTIKAASGGGGGAAAKPDLVVVNQTISPNPMKADQSFQVKFVVVNVGAQGAAASVATWKMLQGGALNSTCNVPSLDPNDSHPCILSVPAAPHQAGQYPSTIVADVNTAVAELNENNNRVDLSFGVEAALAGKPDLVIRDLELLPSTVHVGHELTVNYKVLNAGNANAGPSKAEWKTPPGGGLSRKCDIPALEPNHSQSCSVTFLSSPNQPLNYGTTATADIDNAVPESNENNNQAKAVLSVKP